MLLLLATLVATVPQATAQSGNPDTSRRPSISARFGWNEVMPFDRFAPLWVTVDPGSRPLDGMVMIEIQQDAMQSAQFVAPFAAAADRPTTVEFTVSIPFHCGKVTIEVTRSDGSRAVLQTWSITPTGRERQLPHDLMHYEDVIATVGETSLPVAAGQWHGSIRPTPTRTIDRWGLGQSREIEDIFQHIMVARVNAAELPTAWIAYDSLRCLVLRAQATPTIPPAAARAIRDWVLDGGRLVVVADHPGLEWLGWVVPPGAASVATGRADAPIELADPRHVPVPAAAREAVSAAPPTIVARPISLTAAGLRDGWRTHWPIPGDDPGSHPAPALIAEGPVGLGFVCIVTMDPVAVTLGVDAAASARLWRDILAGALEPFAPGMPRRDTAAHAYASRPTGDTGNARLAIQVGLDHLADFDVPTGSAFYIVAAASLVLALLVGPVDALLLKRLRMRQASWLTALGWIGLACLAAYSLPTLTREQSGRLGRLNVIDQVHDERGDAAISRQTSLTGLLSGSAGRVSLQSDDPAATWRAVSSIAISPWESPRGAGQSPIVLVTGEAPGSGGSAPTRATTPSAIPMPIWAFRTLLDRGVGSLPINARIVGSGEDLRASITGLPEGAEIVSASLSVARHGVPMRFQRDPASGVFIGVPAPDERSPPIWEPGSNSSAPRYAGPTFTHRHQLDQMPGRVLGVMGADSRADAIDRLLASGRWARLSLHIEGMPIDARSSAIDTTGRTVVARLLLPLPEARAPESRPRWTPPPPSRKTAPPTTGWAPPQPEPIDSPDPPEPDNPDPPDQQPPPDDQGPTHEATQDPPR